MKRQTRAYLFALSAVLMWSTVASAFKITLRYMNHTQLLFSSTFVSLLTFLLLLTARKQLRQLRFQSMNDFLRSALLGFLNPFLYYFLLFKAYTLLPAQEAQALNYTWPIMFVLLSIPLLKQTISFRSLLAIIICFMGVIIISTRGAIREIHLTNSGGTILVLSAALVWALFWIYNVRDKRDEVIKLFHYFLFGFFYIAVVTIMRGGTALPESRALLGAVYIGLFEMGVTFILWSKALKLSETTVQVSKFVYLVPFGSLLFIRFIVGEKIFPSTVFGILFIIAGIILEKLSHRGCAKVNPGKR